MASASLRRLAVAAVLAIDGLYLVPQLKGAGIAFGEVMGAPYWAGSDRPRVPRSRQARPETGLGRAGRRQQPPHPAAQVRGQEAPGQGHDHLRLGARPRWNAAGCLYPDGSSTAEQSVHKQATRVLEGHATKVGGQIRRQATNARMDSARRPPADEAANYLTHLAAYLDCPTALSRGWPILTEIVEGACRQFIKDSTDITGARWGLAGAEAILKLRALKTNGDFR